MKHTSRASLHSSMPMQLLLAVQLVGTTVLRGLWPLVIEGGLLRRLPTVRIAILVTGLALVCQEQLALRVQLPALSSAGGDIIALPTTAEGVAQAGFFSQFANLKSTTSIDHDEAALAYIDRFSKVAKAEGERFGIDSGVLMAAAILSQQSTTTPNDNNVFGEALSDTYESAWHSWRAMSLSAVAATDGHHPTSRKGWIIAVSSLYPNAASTAEELHYILKRYTL